MTPAEVEKFFQFGHLQPKLKEVSKPFCELAFALLKLPACTQRDVALQKLLEAKDAAVRTVLP